MAHVAVVTFGKVKLRLLDLTGEDRRKGSVQLSDSVIDTDHKTEMRSLMYLLSFTVIIWMT